MALYTLSIQKLYENFGEKLSHGYITTEECGSDDFYYDLHNPYGSLACCDGEEVEILGKENNVYTLHSRSAPEDVTFTLTEDEFCTAVINMIDMEIGRDEI